MNEPLLRCLFPTALAVASLGAGAALGETKEVDGIVWTFTIDENGEATLGDGGPAIDTGTTGAIAIPPSFDGIPVTRIGWYAFENCSGLTSITIPDSVTSIGEGAFYNCSGLTSIMIPNSVTSVGWYAFFGCSGLASISIPASLSSIGYDCFDGCDNLRSVTMPGCLSVNGVFGRSMYDQITNIVISADSTDICEDMFSGCSGLESVTIPDTITNIEARAFSWCSALTSIAIPVGVTHVGYDAFDNCPDDLFDLETIPGVRLVNGWAVDCDWNAELAGELDLTGARGVADNAFSWSGLTSVSIPAELVAIGPGAFSRCSSLSAFVVSEDNPRYAARDGVLFSKDGSVLVCCPAAKSGSYAIPDSVTHIEREAFYGCSKLTSITIPDSVSSVGENAFSSCNLLTNALYSQSGTTLWRVPLDTEISFAIPEGVTFIGDYAFSECYNLTLLAIPAGVKRIGDGSFAGCSALTMVSIPGGIERIGDDAFADCEKLSRITFLGTASGVSPSAFPYQAYSEWEDFAAAVPARLDGNLAEMGLEGVSTNLYDEADLHELDVRLAREGEILRRWTVPVVSGVTYTCSVPDLSEFDGAGYRYDIPETESIDVLVDGNETVTFDHWTTNVLLQLEFDGCAWIASPPPGIVRKQLGTTADRTRIFHFSLGDTVRCFGSFTPRIIPGSVSISIGDVVAFRDDGNENLLASGIAGSGNVFYYDGSGSIYLSGATVSGQTIWGECRVEYMDGFVTIVESDGQFVPVTTFPVWAEIDSDPVPGYFMSEPRLTLPPEWTGDVDGVFLEEFDDRYGLFIPTDRPRHVLVQSRGIAELVEKDISGEREWVNGPVGRLAPDFGEIAVAGWRLVADSTAADGISLRSEEIDAGESAAIRLPLRDAGTLSFDWKISSGNGHFARFYLDGVMTNEISEVAEWTSVELALGDGPHLLQWSYEKGTTAEVGEDAAFLDNVCWSPLTLKEALDATNLTWKTDSTSSYSVSYSVSSSESYVQDNKKIGVTSSDEKKYKGELAANLVAGSVSIFIGDAVVFQDDGNGNLIATGVDGTGIVAYSTGIVQIKLNTMPTPGQSIVANYRYWKGGETYIVERGWLPVFSVSSDGKDSVRSPEINGKSTSRLSTTVLGPGTFTWKWKADVAGSAGVKVYLDGEDLYDDGIHLEGNSGWADAMLEIGNFGNHAIVFEYWNAGTTNTLSDCAYIDQVSWTPSKPVSVIAEGVEVPVPWIDEAARPFVETSGGDYETAAKDTAANGADKVWQCYVSGISPTNAAERFEARIKFENGEPVVTWNPDLGASRDYVVEGKETLGDGWGPTNAASRFFRVKVKLP